jgi:FRG domain
MHETIARNLARLKDSWSSAAQALAGVVFDEGGASHSGVPTVVVSRYEALVRVVGYFKFEAAKQRRKVVYRGQERSFPGMIPSAYRPSARPAGSTTEAVGESVETFVDAFRKSFKRVDPKAVHRLTTEPLLQHYGIRTRWIDAVDSIPHALFFSVYALTRSGGALWDYQPSKGEHCYLYLFDCGRLERVFHDYEAVPGLSSSAGLAFCDLREAKPSVAIRPHMQHGMLLRPTRGEDLWDHILVQIAMPTREAQAWLAGAYALSPAALFPAPIPWDAFYETLCSSRGSEAVARATRETGAHGPFVGEIMRFSFIDYGPGAT